MDRVSVKLALRSMWAILFHAEQRPATAAEVRELARLLAILDIATVNLPGFDDRVDELTLAVRTCGLFEEPPREPKGLAMIRARIDDLTAFI